MGNGPRQHVPSCITRDGGSKLEEKSWKILRSTWNRPPTTGPGRRDEQRGGGTGDAHGDLARAWLFLRSIPHGGRFTIGKPDDLGLRDGGE